MDRGTEIILMSFAIFLVLAATTVLFSISNYEIVNEGRLLQYTTSYVYEISIADKLRVYVEPEVHLSYDVLNAFFLTGISFIALTFAAIRIQRHGKNPGSIFWFHALLSLGTMYLSADELLGIHESLGHNLPILAEIPGIRRPDDFIILAYGVGAALFLLSFYRVLLGSRRTLWLFGVAILLVLASAISDITGLKLEEPMEVTAGLFLMAGTLSSGLSTDSA